MIVDNWDAQLYSLVVKTLPKVNFQNIPKDNLRIHDIAEAVSVKAYFISFGNPRPCRIGDEENR